MVHQWKKMKDSVEKKEYKLKIYSLFIPSNAIYQLNIPKTVLKKVEESYNDKNEWENEFIFDPVVYHVEKSMEDSFCKFIEMNLLKF